MLIESSHQAGWIQRNVPGSSQSVLCLHRGMQFIFQQKLMDPIISMSLICFFNGLVILFAFINLFGFYMKDIRMCLYLVWTYLSDFLYKNNLSQRYVLKGVPTVFKFDGHCPGSFALEFRWRKIWCISSWLRSLTPHVCQGSPVTGRWTRAERAAMTLRAKAVKLTALQHFQSLPVGSFSSSTPLQSCEHGLYFAI